MSDLLLVVIGQQIVNIILGLRILAIQIRQNDIEQKPKGGTRRSGGAGGSCNGCPPPE